MRARGNSHHDLRLTARCRVYDGVCHGVVSSFTGKAGRSAADIPVPKDEVSSTARLLPSPYRTMPDQDGSSQKSSVIRRIGGPQMPVSTKSRRAVLEVVSLRTSEGQGKKFLLPVPSLTGSSTAKCA